VLVPGAGKLISDQGADAMKPLADAINSQLFWEQPKISQRNYILRSEEDTFGQLHFNSAFNTTAEATSGDEHWIIKQLGFLSDRISVQSKSSDVELANYLPDWTGTVGEIQFSTGEKYCWGATNFIGTKFTISIVDSPELITYQSGTRRRKFSDLFKQQAQIVIAPDAWQIKELPILVSLGWYLVIVRMEDAAVIASTASLGALY
jgi:hypothetical protein